MFSRVSGGIEIKFMYIILHLNPEAYTYFLVVLLIFTTYSIYDEALKYPEKVNIKVFIYFLKNKTLRVLIIFVSVSIHTSPFGIETR